MSGEVLLAMFDKEKIKSCLENQIALIGELNDFSGNQISYIYLPNKVYF